MPKKNVQELEKKIKDKKAYVSSLKSQISAAAAAAQREAAAQASAQAAAQAQAQQQEAQAKARQRQRNRRKSRVNIRPHFIHTRRRLFRSTSSSSQI